MWILFRKKKKKLYSREVEPRATNDFKWTDGIKSHHCTSPANIVGNPVGFAKLRTRLTSKRTVCRCNCAESQTASTACPSHRATCRGTILSGDGDSLASFVHPTLEQEYRSTRPDKVMIQKLRVRKSGTSETQSGSCSDTCCRL